MKKILTLMASFAIIGCTSTIDKKIVVTDYSKDIETIKSEHKEYSDADYAKASKDLDKYAMKVMSGENTLDITYKELLEGAKKENAKIKAENDKYEASVNKLREAYPLTITNGKYAETGNPMYPHGYITDLTSENKTGKEITAIKGSILLENAKGDRLLKIGVEEAVNFAPGEKAEGQLSNIIFEDDNPTELKALPFSAIKQRWIPSKLIFKDGSTMEALPEPIHN